MESYPKNIPFTPYLDHCINLAIKEHGYTFRGSNPTFSSLQQSHNGHRHLKEFAPVGELSKFSLRTDLILEGFLHSRKQTGSHTNIEWQKM